MTITRQIALSKAAWAIAWIALLPASSAHAGVEELFALLNSPAGRVVLAESGMPERVLGRLSVNPSALPAADAEALEQSLGRIRADYLRRFPEEREMFEPSEEGEVTVSGGRARALRELTQVEGTRSIPFTDLGTKFRTYTYTRTLFLRDNAASGLELLRALPLPESYRLDLNRDQASRLFSLARSSWDAGFDPAQLRNLLSELASGRVERLTPETQASLKALRKRGTVLRSAYAVLGDGHEPPSALHELIRDLGKVNDAIEAGVPDQIPARAQAALQSLDKRKLARALERFAPASRGSIRDYAQGLVRDSVRLARRDTLPIESFHDLRKQMKELLAAMQLIERRTPSSDGSRVTNYLFELNEMMGHFHDEVVARELRGGVHYDGSSIEVPKAIRKAILKFSERFGIQG